MLDSRSVTSRLVNTSNSELRTQIEYLAIERKSEAELIISQKFTRLRDTCNCIQNYVQNCRVKIANIAGNKSTDINYAYLVSINLILSEGLDVYTLRVPRFSEEDSINTAIADAFAKTYRQLIELRFFS